MQWFSIEIRKTGVYGFGKIYGNKLCLLVSLRSSYHIYLNYQYIFSAAGFLYGPI